MKHHIFHKSYRHFHILSFIIAVVIAGVWIHLSTQTAKSDIKLGYIRNFTTTNSDDLGDIKNDTKPRGTGAAGGSPAGGSTENGSPAGTSGGDGNNGGGGGVIKQMATSLVTYVKQLIGLADTQSTPDTSAPTDPSQVVVPDPCLALTDVNRVSILNQSATARSAAEANNAGNVTQTTSSRKAQAQNPCAKLPVELLPCVDNYSTPASATEQASSIKRESAQSVARGVSAAEQVNTKNRDTKSTTTVSCNFIKADTAKESLKRTLLNTVQSVYLPTTDLKAGDSGPAVVQLQKLFILLGDNKEQAKQPTGVYDAATVEAITKFQEDASKRFQVAITGNFDSATRIAFLSILSLQIDEFLSPFKDYTYATGAVNPETSATTLTKISLDKVPVVKKDTSNTNTDVTYTDVDPCLALVPVSDTSGPGKNPCHYIPASLLSCAINYEVNEKGDVVYNAARGGEACKFVKASSAQASLQQTIMVNATSAISNLKPGDTSRSVAVLQSLLNTALFVRPDKYEVVVDGNYGAAVTNFIKQFQASVGLTPDGVLGKDTQTKLLSGFNAVLTTFLANYSDKNATVATFAGDPCAVLTLNGSSGSSSSAPASTPAAPSAPASSASPTPAPAEKAETAYSSAPSAQTVSLVSPCAKAPQVLVPCAAEYADPKNYPKKSSCVFPAATTAQQSLMDLIMKNVTALLPSRDVTFVLGTTGDGVKSLQILINAVFGLSDKPVVAENGIYDASMISYIADLQKALGLKNDGVFGVDTRNALQDKIKALIYNFVSNFTDSSLKTK